MACQCSACVRLREIRLHIERLPEDRQEFFNGLVDELIDTSDERDYYKAIVRGTWPDADEIIARYRPAKLDK